MAHWSVRNGVELLFAEQPARSGRIGSVDRCQKRLLDDDDDARIRQLPAELSS